MSLEIKIPSVGESVQEAVLAEWFKQDGDSVSKDEPLFVIETDKVTLEVVAEADGVLKIGVQAGETVAIGAVVGSIEPAEVPAAAPEKPKTEKASPAEKAKPEEKPPEAAAPPAKAPSPPTPPTSADEIPLAPSVRRLARELKALMDAAKEGVPADSGERAEAEAAALAVEDAGNGRVGIMHRQAAHQVDGLC